MEGAGWWCLLNQYGWVGWGVEGEEGCRDML